MITGGLAVAAAALAAWLARGQLDAARRQIAVARDQITTTEKAAARDRNGRLRAARASLAATLSAVCDYAEVVAQELMALMAEPLKKNSFRPKITKFPIEALSTLGRIIELADDDAVSERIESLLRESQMLDARTDDLSHDGDSDREWYEWVAICIEQSAAINVIASSMFRYARREAESTEEVNFWDGVFNTFQSFGVYDHIFWETIDGARSVRRTKLKDTSNKEGVPL